MCVVVGGEVALFQKNINPKGVAGLAPSPNLWDPTILTRPGSAFAVARPMKKRPGSASAAGAAAVSDRLTSQASAPTLSSVYVAEGDAEGVGGGGGEFGAVLDAAAGGDEEVAREMGAPRGSGRLARLVRPGEVFGERAVLRRGGGEARAATAVALRRPATLLTLRKWAYDAILRAVVGID